LTISTSIPFAGLLQHAYRAADAAISQELRNRGFDVRATHSAVLANIDIATGTRATVLAERAAVSKQAIGELVVDLEEKGYIERVRDPADGRAKLIRLTKQGGLLIDAAYEVIQEIQLAMVKKVGTKKADAAAEALEALIEFCSRAERR
jgi:DNA-binding MarR family transcriptional regulator